MSRDFSHTPLDPNMMSPTIQWLIGANVIAFALAWLAGGSFNDLFGLVPAHVTRDHWLWQIVTYLFLHANLFHLLFNLFTLWMFAVPVEAQWGSKEFLKYYFLCGIGAGLISVALTPHSSMPIIGASGAIYGLLVAFAMLYPDAIVYMYLFFPLKAKHMAILCGLIEFVSGVENTTPGIARYAHLGGMLIGYFYIRWWWVVKIQAKGVWWSLAETEPSAGPSRGRSSWLKSPRLRAPQRTPEEEVDRILDKISAFGQDSLSPEEKELLRRVSERQRPEGHA